MANKSVEQKLLKGLSAYTIIAVLLMSSCAPKMNETQQYLGQQPPGEIPEVFAPGLITSVNYEHSPAVFAPDMKSVYWTFEKQNPTRGVIKYMTFINGVWSKPSVASFSGDYTNDTPYLTRDGKTLFFCSKRPLNGEEKGWHLWYVNKTDKGWSEPFPLGLHNKMPFSGYLTIADNGEVVFAGRGIDSKDPRDIFTAEFKNGRLSDPVRLEGINGPYMDGYPNISRDGSFLIFESNRPGGLGELDLYIVLREKDGNWGKPQHLGAPINSPKNDRYGQLSPDSKYLFFGSDRGGNMDVYWVDASVLKCFL